MRPPPAAIPATVLGPSPVFHPRIGPVWGSSVARDPLGSPEEGQGDQERGKASPREHRPSEVPIRRPSATDSKPRQPAVLLQSGRGTYRERRRNPIGIRDACSFPSPRTPAGTPSDR